MFISSIAPDFERDITLPKSGLATHVIFRGLSRLYHHLTTEYQMVGVDVGALDYTTCTVSRLVRGGIGA